MMFRQFGLLTLRRGSIVATLLAVAAITASAAGAQNSVKGVPNAMQGFSQNRDQPIQIDAASLEMIDKKKQATFSGGVKVVQGDTTMKSNILVAFYDNAGKAPIKSATPGPGGSSSIRRLEAKGNVVVTQKDQVVTGEKAVFDTKANSIAMSGGVVLTQCNNVMRGDRLVVDMTTGDSRLESDSGHVQVLLAQAGQGCGSPVPAPGSPGAPPGSKKK
jgi:lipopolysaccharide export system protein LptA